MSAEALANMSLEELILSLLVNDSGTIKQATEQLSQRMQNVATISELFNLLRNHQNKNVRQYAALMLSRHLSHAKNWNALSTEQHDTIKQNIYQLLFTETDKTPRHAITKLMSVVLKHVTENSWIDEILATLFTAINSPDVEQAKKSLDMLVALTNYVPEYLKSNHKHDICAFFYNIASTSNSPANLISENMLNLLEVLGNMIPESVGETQTEQAFQKTLPSVLTVIEAFAQPNVDSDNFLRAFYILDQLLEYMPRLLTIFVKDIVALCTRISENLAIEPEKRVRVLCFLGWLCQYKKSSIVKLKLVEPIANLLFKILTVPPTDDADVDEFFDDADDEPTPLIAASQSLDLMALHIPGDVFYPEILKLLEPALQSENLLYHRAAYLTMATIAEGCAKKINDKYLRTMIDLVKVGITKDNLLVRNAAFYALGQFSEYLQPEISQYHQEIMPILLEFLQQIVSHSNRMGAPESKNVSRMFYALEVFCENLETEQLEPYLPTVVEKLYEVLNPANPVQLREYALSAIGAVIAAAKELFKPYLETLMNSFAQYMVDTDDKDIIYLRKFAIDKLAIVIANVGEENYRQYAKHTMAFAIATLEKCDDPEDKRAIYYLLAAMAETFGNDISATFPHVVNKLYESILSPLDGAASLKSTDSNAGGDAEGGIEIDLEDSDEEDDDDDDNIIQNLGDNVYVEEKEQALCTLQQFAKHCEQSFLPFLEKSFDLSVKLIKNYPTDDIRKVSVLAATTFVISMMKNTPNVQAIRQHYLDEFLETLESVLYEETECEVAIEIVEAYALLLQDLKRQVVPDDVSVDKILRIIEDVVNHKLKCQFPQIVEEVDDDEDESSFEYSIIESAGDLLPALGQALASPSQFNTCFNRIALILMDKLQKKKKRVDEDDCFMHYFVLGVFADSFRHLGPLTANYFDHLLPVFLRFIHDKNDRVRQNAIFGLGELIHWSKPKSFESYPRILSELSTLIAQERKPSVLDNICSAICRMIMANHSLIPLEQVLPVLFEHLPLKSDFCENSAVYAMLEDLYGQRKDLFMPYFERVIQMTCNVVNKKQYENEETRSQIVRFFVRLRNDQPESFDAVVSGQAIPFLNA